MARPGPALPAWYLTEQFGIQDPKEKQFAAQLLEALEKISPELTPRVLRHPLVHQIARGPKAFPALLEMYEKSIDEAERGLALDAIAEILANREFEPTHEVVVALEKILAGAKSERLATIAARALAAAKAENFLELQRNLLASKNLNEVRMAARLLGYGRYKRAVPVLMEILRPDAATIADAVIWSLGEIGDESALPLVQLWLARAEFADDALNALGKIGSRASVVRIVPFLLEGTKEQREKAAEAMMRIVRRNDGTLGDPGLDETVRKTLDKIIDGDESRLARFYALVTFSLLGGHVEPARILGALGGQLSKKELDAVGGLLTGRTAAKTPEAKGKAPAKGPGPTKPVKKGKRGV